MNYQLELNTRELNNNLVFNTIIFDSFKINIIERYFMSSIKNNAKLDYVVIKVRTLDDQIIETKKDNHRVRLKNDELRQYLEIKKELTRHVFKNTSVPSKEIELKYVNLLLGFVISNYSLN